MRFGWKRISHGRLLLRLECGKKTLRFRSGACGKRRLIPFVKRGPFGTWLASWRWGQVEWSPSRWS